MIMVSLPSELPLWVAGHKLLPRGWTMPDFAHLPLIHGPDGKKLSRLGAMGRQMGVAYSLEETSATQGVAILVCPWAWEQRMTNLYKLLPMWCCAVKNSHVWNMIFNTKSWWGGWNFRWNCNLVSQKWPETRKRHGATGLEEFEAKGEGFVGGEFFNGDLKLHVNQDELGFHFFKNDFEQQPCVCFFW